ncbi:gamma carbonic anhydrase family protein [Pararobbsia silviterrae]|uniref:Gamma carbonic anhydrase family protein n=1 Tax=Pararobbsia silviterrae TaxID=1792498 RepID=A0A494WYD1_9BURK|nr:gamma carbonic anhydrase family protein [Pararobbsia silviterrae]RKP43548.1 gamma carbonic anhydrase family protein [Pararobbsia silviterrae]
MTLFSLDDVTPVIADETDYWVAPQAQVVGAVRLGRAVSVWFGAVIRGDNEWIEIGARTNVQDGAVLHSDPGSPLHIGEDCTVGHRAILHGCTLGDGVLVGMGAIVMNGAVIGHGSVVGAGAVVTEGKQFPERSLIVGCPAKVVRTLSDQTRVDATRDALAYVAKSRRFRERMRALGSIEGNETDLRAS